MHNSTAQGLNQAVTGCTLNLAKAYVIIDFTIMLNNSESPDNKKQEDLAKTAEPPANTRIQRFHHTAVSTPPPNLLRPRPLPREKSARPERKKHRLLYGLLVLLFLYGANRVITGLTLAQWPGTGGEYDLKTLQPKKSWLFGSIKNFIFKSDNLLIGQKDDRINLLLMGIGGPGHDGAFLSDTNIILSIKPSTKQVALISIPRDLGVKIGDHGIRKINNANAFGEAANPGAGGDYARIIFEQTFGLTIPYYVRVDFKAFVELINEVGGVTIAVPRSFTDYQYPGPNYSYETVSFVAGNELMKGDRALIYTRSRHGGNGEGSDFARSRRQQQVLTALKEKLLSIGTYTNPVRIQNILDALSEHVSTNLDFGQLMYLASIGKDTDNKIIPLVIDDSANGFLNGGISASGAYLLTPRGGNFTAVNTAIAQVFDPTFVAPSPPPVTAQNAPPPAAAPTSTPHFPNAQIAVENGTWQVGLAARLKKHLEAAGFSVASIGNSNVRPIATSTIFIANQKIAPELITALNKELPLPTTTVAPPWLSDTTSSSTTALPKRPDIVIIIGTDYTN